MGKEKKKIRKKNKKKFDKNYIYKFSIIEVLVLILISVVFGVITGYILSYNHGSLSKTRNDSNLRDIVDTYNNIMTGYYDNVDGSRLSEAAVRGMIDVLGDAYSMFMDDSSTDEFNKSIDGSFVGIGVTTLFEEEYNKIILVHSDGPAARAGIKDGDIILAVDDNDCHNVNGEDLTNLVTGKKGTSVKIKVRRGEEELEFNVVRDKIELSSVTSSIYDENIGYIKIDLFSATSAENFSKALASLEKDKIKSLIIDVRGNPGGQLSQVSEILSTFFPKKTVLYQLESNGKRRKINSLNKDTRGYPVVVLASEGSASASEVLVSCFKDNYKKSLIVGTNTYGKGTVQRTQKLTSGSSVKFTIQKWLTSKGKDINGIGVEPDVFIEQGVDYYSSPTSSNDVQLQEAIRQIKEMK